MATEAESTSAMFGTLRAELRAELREGFARVDRTIRERDRQMQSSKLDRAMVTGIVWPLVVGIVGLMLLMIVGLLALSS